MIIGVFYSSLLIAAACIAILFILGSRGFEVEKEKKPVCCAQCEYYDNYDYPVCTYTGEYKEIGFDSHRCTMDCCPYNRDN